MTKQQAMTILQGLTAEQRALLAYLLPMIEAARPRTDKGTRGKPPERRCSN